MARPSFCVSFGDPAIFLLPHPLLSPGNEGLLSRLAHLSEHQAHRGECSAQGIDHQANGLKRDCS